MYVFKNYKLGPEINNRLDSLTESACNCVVEILRVSAGAGMLCI